MCQTLCQALYLHYLIVSSPKPILLMRKLISERGDLPKVVELGFKPNSLIPTFFINQVWNFKKNNFLPHSKNPTNCFSSYLPMLIHGSII